MSYHVFFSFSTSLAKNMKVPKGTLERITSRIEYTERILGLERTPTYTPEGEKQRPGWHWHHTEKNMLEMAGHPADKGVHQYWLLDRERESRIASMALAVRLHNQEIEWLYNDLRKWSEKEKWKRGEAETITVKQSREFWGGLTMLELPKELWDREHYTDHMDHLHTLLTTGESRGVILDCPPFNPEQTEALISLLDGELDQWGFDARFSIPLDENLKPYNLIASSYDGGYDWCEKCGPIHSDDFYRRCAICPHAKTGECCLKNSHPAEFEDEDEDEDDESDDP